MNLSVSRQSLVVSPLCCSAAPGAPARCAGGATPRPPWRRRGLLVVVFKWYIFILLSQIIYSSHSWDIQVLPIAETTAKRSGTPPATTTTPTSTVPVSTVVPTKNKNPNQTKEAKSAISDPTCQLLVRNATISSDYEFYRAVHESQVPACAAGTWKYLPDMVVIPSEEHLI